MRIISKLYLPSSLHILGLSFRITFHLFSKSLHGNFIKEPFLFSFPVISLINYYIWIICLHISFLQVIHYWIYSGKFILHLGYTLILNHQLLYIISSIYFVYRSKWLFSRICQKVNHPLMFTSGGMFIPSLGLESILYFYILKVVNISSYFMFISLLLGNIFTIFTPPYLVLKFWLFSFYSNFCQIWISLLIFLYNVGSSSLSLHLPKFSFWAVLLLRDLYQSLLA